MADNRRNNQSVYQSNDINTIPIRTLYKKFYTTNWITTNNPCSFPPPKTSIITNRDIYNCTDECIRSKQLSKEYDILRK